MKPIVLKKRFYLNKQIYAGIRDYQVSKALAQCSPIVVKFNIKINDTKIKNINPDKQYLHILWWNAKLIANPKLVISVSKDKL